MSSSFEAHFGKYRGSVTDNLDPAESGSVEVTVPPILGHLKIWALPCIPYAGPQVGFVCIPPIGANVWVEFENGDLSKPIWSGCFWEEGEFPEEALSDYPNVTLLKTNNITLALTDIEGETSIKLSMLSPALAFEMSQNGIALTNNAISIEINDNEIKLTNGAQSIQIVEEKVSINGNHLEIM